MYEVLIEKGTYSKVKEACSYLMKVDHKKIGKLSLKPIKAEVEFINFLGKNAEKLKNFKNSK